MVLHQQSKIECRENIKRSNGNQIKYRTMTCKVLKLLHFKAIAVELRYAIFSLQRKFFHQKGKKNYRS